jgi:hypothetical protein
MCLIYVISFLFALPGIFGVGHLFAGEPRRGLMYFAAGLIWMLLGGLLVLASGSLLLICIGPLHLLFAHFCATDAIRNARGASIQPSK